MRAPIRLAALLLLVPAAATAGDDLPLVPIGLPFTPEAPRPLAPDHPLYHRVVVEPVTGMPARVGGTFTLATRPAEFDAALRDTLQRLNMLAPDAQSARARLMVRWEGLEVPFRISFDSHATARLAYRLTRIDNGQRIFDREITTQASSRGGDGSARERGNARLALMTNLASLAVCLDHAAYGEAPNDCALTPGFSYEAPRPPLIMFMRR